MEMLTMAPDKKAYPKRVIPEGKSQVNFSLENELLEKVKDIAHTEGVSNAELYSLATKRFVEAYEKKHGKIKARPHAKGLENL